MEGALHIRVRELGEYAMADHTHGDHPLPFFASGTRDARSVFVDGHLQSKEDRGFVLVEYGHEASAVNDGNSPIENVGHVASFAIYRPDARRSDLVGKGLLLLLVRKPLLLEVGPIGAAVVVGRRADMQCV